MSKKLILMLFLSLVIIAHGLSVVTEAKPVSKDIDLIIEPIPTPTPTPTPKPVVKKEPELKSLGEFKLTAYCGCSKCCGKWAKDRPTDEDGKTIVCGAIGKRLISNYSIAVDPKVIPYGTVVIIDGHEYEAMDCGGGIKGNRIDVYFDSHDEAKEFAVRKSEIFIKELD